MTAHSTVLVLPLGPAFSAKELLDLIEFGGVRLECDLEVAAGLQVQPEPVGVPLRGRVAAKFDPPAARAEASVRGETRLLR